MLRKRLGLVVAGCPKNCHLLTWRTKSFSRWLGAAALKDGVWHRSLPACVPSPEGRPRWFSPTRRGPGLDARPVFAVGDCPGYAVDDAVEFPDFEVGVFGFLGLVAVDGSV